MLYEYIKEYIVAQDKNDKKTMKRIERALQSVGMDRITLLALAKELRVESVKNN